MGENLKGPSSFAKSIREIEAHDARISQYPIVDGIPHIIFSESSGSQIKMVIPIKDKVDGVQVMDLISGIGMPVELVAGKVE